MGYPIWTHTRTHLVDVEDVFMLFDLNRMLQFIPFVQWAECCTSCQGRPGLGQSSTETELVWGVSINGGSPIAGWFSRWKILFEWMIGRHPHSRKPLMWMWYVSFPHSECLEKCPLRSAFWARPQPLAPFKCVPFLRHSRTA